MLKANMYYVLQEPEGKYLSVEYLDNNDFKLFFGDRVESAVKFNSTSGILNYIADAQELGYSLYKVQQIICLE